MKFISFSPSCRCCGLCPDLWNIWSKSIISLEDNEKQCWQTTSWALGQTKWSCDCSALKWLHQNTRVYLYIGKEEFCVHIIHIYIMFKKSVCVCGGGGSACWTFCFQPQWELYCFTIMQPRGSLWCWLWLQVSWETFTTWQQHHFHLKSQQNSTEEHKLHMISDTKHCFSVVLQSSQHCLSVASDNGNALWKRYETRTSYYSWILSKEMEIIQLAVCKSGRINTHVVYYTFSLGHLSIGNNTASFFISVHRASHSDLPFFI